MTRSARVAALCALLSACSAENTEKRSDTALEPQPVCGASALSSCLRDPPPLSEQQKKVFFAAMDARTRQANVLEAFRFDSKPQDPLSAELVETLRREGCQKESSTGPDGRTTFKVIGERCPLASLRTYLSTQQEQTYREEEGNDLIVSSEDFARKAGLRRLATNRASSSVTVDLGNRRLRIEGQGSEKSSFDTSEDDKAASDSGFGLRAEVDLSKENEIRVVSLQAGEVTRSQFPGFQAVLRINIDFREDGTGTIEAFLNGEKIVGQKNQLAGLALDHMRSWATRLAREAVRR